MKLEFQHSYPADPAAVAALLKREEFLADIAQHAQAREYSVAVHGTVTELMMEVPVPGNAAKAIGTTVRLNITMDFPTAACADGTLPGSVRVAVPGMPVEAWADATLTPTANGCAGNYEGEVKVKIPIVGKKVEAQVEPFVVAAFAGIESRSRLWLTQ